MNKSNRMIVTFIPVILILVFALSYVPHKMISIKPSDVSKMTIFDGNNGQETIIVDKHHINHIITNLNSVTFQKDKPSFGYLGYRFRTTIFDHKGKQIEALIINSSDTIRYKGFFYKAKENTIDYEYIMDIVNR